MNDAQSHLHGPRVVEPSLRDKFDRWYATEHLPWACRAFKCEKAWRYWSTIDRNVHYALYRFADELSMDAALAGQELKELIADFDRAWRRKRKAAVTA